MGRRMTGIRLENISKSFGGNRVIKGISLSIEKGEFVSILGPSGCGKTTLIKLIAGLEAPDSGDVFLGGVHSNGVSARKRGAVIVFQDYGLFPHMTVAKNVEFGLAARGMGKKERAAKVSRILERMRVGEKAASYPHELSGGQKQRVALARACVLNPNVLLLDEPFSALDASLRDDMREFVSNLHKELSITTILVTHDKKDAFTLSRRMGVILDGRLAQMAAPADVYSRPESRKVADFTGEANYVEGEVQSGVFACPLGEFRAPLRPDGPATLMLRRDQIQLAQSGVPCQIQQKQFQGHTTTYTVAIQGGGIKLKLNFPGDSYAQGQAAHIQPTLGAGWVLPQA